MTPLPTAILDSLASGILVVDLESRIVFVNRAMARRLGIRREEWLGRPGVELGSVVESRLTSPDVFRSRLDWTKDPEARGSQELEWRDGDQVVYLREDSGPLYETQPDGSARVAGRVLAYHDISREKAIDRMKTEFIAVASHELRTPMTSIKGSVDLILSGFAGEVSAETQELIEIAQKSCDRLIRLINDILDLAKIEAGQVKLKLMPLDLGDVVERSIRSVKSFADQSALTLRMERPETLPAVEVDKDRMEQVVTNLLSNAIKFSPPRGEVVVTLSTGGNLNAPGEAWVQCVVADQGCGIHEEELGRVFGKFQQVGDSRRKGGTGLGLAITQALVHEHKGRIWVESRVNEGSRFIFQLPVASSAPAVPAAGGLFERR